MKQKRSPGGFPFHTSKFCCIFCTHFLGWEPKDDKSLNGTETRGHKITKAVLTQPPPLDECVTVCQILAGDLATTEIKCSRFEL